MKYMSNEYLRKLADEGHASNISGGNPAHKLSMKLKRGKRDYILLPEGDWTAENLTIAKNTERILKESDEVNVTPSLYVVYDGRGNILAIV